MKDRFKFRIRVCKNCRTINGTFKGVYTYYCNGFYRSKTGYHFYGDGKKYSFLNKNVLSVDQCTGLKDKNGKLIYEGDIVKFNTPRNGLRIGQVKFDTDCALFEVRYLDNTNDWELMDKYNYEVIGNIYENKEQQNE